MAKQGSESQVAVVLGGSRGIGLAIAEKFARNDYVVIVASRTSPLDRDFSSWGSYVPCDASQRSEVIQLADRIAADFGPPATWINNVGLSAWRPISGVDEDFLSQMLSVNLKTTFWGCQAAVSLMSDRGGVITNLSSIAGKRGTPNNSVYCAAKFGVNGMTQALSKELGPKKIRVNALCPVLVQTEGLLAALGDSSSPAHGESEKFIADFAARESPLGCLPTEEDVAEMALFLSSEAAQSITGQCISIDCGVLPG